VGVVGDEDEDDLVVGGVSMLVLQAMVPLGCRCRVCCCCVGSSLVMSSSSSGSNNGLGKTAVPMSNLLQSLLARVRRLDPSPSSLL